MSNESTRQRGTMVVPVIDDKEACGLPVTGSEFDTDYDGDDRFSFHKLWQFVGPGFLMSIAYLDPGNIESDLQAGALGVYSLLWVLLWSTILGGVLQVLAARLGVVTGKNLAQLCRDRYGPVSRYSLWVLTELAIVGSDIQEILTYGWMPIWVGVLVTALDTFTFLFLEGYGIRRLELLFLLLISMMVVSFGAEYAISGPDFGGVIKGTLVPTLSRPIMTQAVAMVGAVIMPHNLFLHSALVQTRNVDRQSAPAVRQANFYYAIETVLALACSFFVNAAVVSVFAQGFFGQPGVDVASIGLNNAGNYLQKKYGDVALYLWGVGVLAAGQASTMTGTYAGQYVMDGFLAWRIPLWKRVLITRMVAIVPAMLVAILAFDHLDRLNEWLSVLQCVLLPFALLPVLTFTSETSTMGSFANSRKTLPFLVAIGMAVTGLNIGLIFVKIPEIFGTSWTTYSVLGVGLVLYLASFAALALMGINPPSEETQPLLRQKVLTRQRSLGQHYAPFIAVPPSSTDVE